MTLVRERAWCGTYRGGVFRSDDGGRAWQSVGLGSRLIHGGSYEPNGPKCRVGGHRAK